MNIFKLDDDPVISAQEQCDKHVVKMPTESAQMLSTAHRILDGYTEKRLSVSGKSMITYWVHPDSNMEETLYKAVHHKHPSTLWTMESNNNYNWHYTHFCALCDEYEYRYGKKHGADLRLREVLATPPRNIEVGRLTKMALAMKSNPECMFEDDVKSLRAFYQTKQDRFKMIWSKRNVPEWFSYA